MLVVHHLNNSRSQRILWLLEELGLPYDVKRYERDPRTLLAPPALREVHPLGKSPVISDDGQVIAESGAIIEYLLERYDPAGTFAPPLGTALRQRLRYWLHYAEGSLMPLLVMKLVFNRVAAQPMPFFARPVARGIAKGAERGFLDPQLARHLDYLEGELAGSDWFVGNEFSAADVQMSFPLEAAAARGALRGTHPRLAAFLERIHARPAYARALARGGPYELMR
ncbi:glutathione S-transferase family protein [Chitinasiproducens palmae]|uniref:glutathione transferase n=1 Tax=Chitinasiproducens palmae TaxID=1770053 RepID=A0A1H2PP91_9BURK|nr:glutathione S-transferase [Chitinasiproducens palmae]SDV48079.1 glutathione S-transferase [Chitinasiproducens palmae]